ncbi:MAG: CaiB/BaiF CoA transferase family protein, partial [Solirubrobacteraceae bacterium]
FMSVTGDPDGSPTKAGLPIADIAAGLFGIVGVLAALLERGRSGLGQRVSTSLLAGQVGIHVFQGTRYLVAGQVPGLSGRYHPTVVPYGTFSAADGPVVVGVGNDALWRRFAGVLGLDPDDPRFATNADRLARRDELHGLIDSVLRTRDAATWVERLSATAVPAGEVRTLDRVYADKQVRDQGLVWDVEHPTLGHIELPGSPIRFSRTELSARQPPPRLGEHTEAIRSDLGSGRR